MLLQCARRPSDHGKIKKKMLSRCVKNVYVTRKCCVLVLHQFDDRSDVLFPSNVDSCRPETRRKASALYWDGFPRQTKFGDNRALADRKIQRKNAWEDRELATINSRYRAASQAFFQHELFTLAFLQTWYTTETSKQQ